ncbi:MAG TPA: GNAT family N-acetyltransferase [Candidatus Dormibacteraeota bacterium]|nr:GNAT family N-acetyltransferase [Candidatus Dormibacteraeota bacterium]
MSVEVIPPFRAIPGRSGELVGFNYALPVDPLDERLPAAIDALWARYRALREPLRIEFNEETWPELGAALERAGLVLETLNTLMACEPQEFRPFAAPSVVVGFLESDPRRASTLRAVGELDRQVAGRASMGTVDGVAELYGVVTDPPFRRRGVAATICSALIERHFHDGGTLVFLDAENPGAEALYASLGFRRIGVRLSYAEPAEASFSRK